MNDRLVIKEPFVLELWSASSRFSKNSEFPVGVFGAGKSFLLAVVILFLVEVFERNNIQNQASNQ